MPSKDSRFVASHLALPEFLKAVFRHPQTGWRNKVHLRAKVRQGISKRVHRSAVFQVAQETDGNAFQRPFCFSDGIEVKKGLRGMLIGAVARVNDRHTCDVGGQPGGTLKIVPQNNDIAIAVDNLYGIAEDSPFAVEEALGSAKPITVPPSRFIADSKLSLVLVDGSKNNEASILPFRISVWLYPSMCFERSRMYNNSSLLKCRIEIISRCLKLAMVPQS